MSIALSPISICLWNAFFPTILAILNNCSGFLLSSGTTWFWTSRPTRPCWPLAIHCNENIFKTIYYWNWSQFLGQISRKGAAHFTFNQLWLQSLTSYLWLTMCISWPTIAPISLTSNMLACFIDQSWTPSFSLSNRISIPCAPVIGHTIILKRENTNWIWIWATHCEAVILRSI